MLYLKTKYNSQNLRIEIKSFDLRGHWTPFLAKAMVDSSSRKELEEISTERRFSARKRNLLIVSYC